MTSRVAQLSNPPSREQSPVLRPISSASRRPLRRTNTNNTNNTNQSEDAASIIYTAPAGEEIPSVRPVVDNHDRLWAEIDVLDDAAEMARQASMNGGSFFGKAHAEALEKLRQAQTELVTSMAITHAKNDKDNYRNTWEINDIDALRKNLFDEQQFETISKHVKETIDKLDTVASYMNAVDDQSKEYWQADDDDR
ncbi:hypothetical protein TRVA0_047S00540 [Trichomonascus vanleenenianus]|uniref:uncharacterized protein n=1 Tax=Trichomonascus vanleenenianus TaxID=2268995 RepID=UPI003EC954F0